jgi:hypothetical protein|uniref:Uncharacterized protein n=1 Tax=Siphoviridae sp. ctOCb13 TaxID=2825477 RepID=A0A8S5Q030_9CAUD|nr:MAG TPA: hypothetical protein [Siphoviridae sp. ctOCb13]
MISQLLISAMMMVTPFHPKESVPELPKQYAILAPEENHKKTSRQERRAKKRLRK